MKKQSKAAADGKIMAEAMAAQFLTMFQALADRGGHFYGKGKDRKLSLGVTVVDSGIITREEWVRAYMATEIQRHWTPKQPKPKKKARKRGS